MTLDVAITHRLGDFMLDVDFAMGARGITALFGPSGAGKSTVINAVAGLLKPQEGRIVLDGRVLADTASGTWVSARKRGVGYVFQDARLFPHLSVRRNLLFGWRRAARRVPENEIAHVIDILGLAPLLERRPGALSGGERQRVALGRALLTGPRLLLLDEPLAALDHRRRQEILPYLERLRDESGIPMLYVSHAVDEVTRLADSVAVLDHGRLLGHGTVTDVFSRLDIFPPEDGFDPGAVMTATVDHRDDDYGLTVLSLSEGTLSVPAIDAAPGETVRIRVRAADVMLALAQPADISANNMLSAEVLEIRPYAGPFADIQLVSGGQRLVARITRRSLVRLGLETGTKVFAVIKTVQIES